MPNLIEVQKASYDQFLMVDEPEGPFYYGGDVAAPVFSTVSSGALRLMSVAPDDLARVTPVVLEETGP